MKEKYCKIPKFRFNKFLESWERLKYEDVIEVNSGKDYKRLDKGDIPVYGTGGYMLSVSEAITNKDGVGIGRKGTINKPYILKAPYWTVDTLFFCIPKNKYNLYFINAIFERTQWERFDESTGVPSLSKLTINNIQNYFPSFNEQSAIGSLFRTLDDLLDSYKDNLANYKSLKATMLSKMFPKAGQTVPEIRLDGFEGEWEVQTLKELASFSKGNGYTKNDLVNSGEEIILYGRLYTNYQTIISKVNTFVTTVKANTVISKGGEVIVPSSGESAEDISRASVVEKSGIILGGDLNIIYPNRNKVNSIFLALTISNGSQQKELIKRAQGKSVVHLRNNDLEKVVLHYPSIEEQQAISSYFSNFDNLINSHQEKISQLETLKKKLLQNMFI